MRPNPDESEADFIARAMDGTELKEAYPVAAHRREVCQSIFATDVLQKEILALDALTVSAREADLPVVFSASETRELAAHVLQDISGVSSEWLGNAVPVVERLLQAAESQTLTDEDFISAVEQIANTMPTLFDRLNWHALAEAMEKAQGAAMANGIVARERDFETYKE